MRFSIYLNPQTRGPHEDVDLIDTITRQAIRATNAGMAGVAMTEHHFSGYNTYGNNFMLASYLAPQLRPGTKLMLAVAVPTLHNPMRLAQSCNLLDILTKGELIVGFAAGGSPLEYAGLGRDPSLRHEQMMQNLDIMERALAHKPSDPPYEWANEFEHGSLRTRIMPSGYRRPSPPFARATQSDEGVAWTAERGWYLFTARETAEVMEGRMRLYGAQLADAGYAPDVIEDRLDWSFVQKQIFVADSDEAALANIRERLVLMADHQKKSFQMTGDITDAAKLKSVVGVSPRDPDEFIERAMVVGSPETVAKQLRAYGDAGVRHMALLFNFGFMTADEADRSLNLFLDNVLPEFADQPAAHATPA